MGVGAERAAWAAFGVARRAAPTVTAARRRARRAAFLAQTRSAARMVRASVDLDVAEDLRVGRDVRVTFEPGSRNVLHVGPGSTFEDRVLIMLKGGSVELGPRVEIRRDVVLNVAGRLRVEGDTPISWGSVLHCSTEVVLEPMVGLAEQVTVADSSHYFTEPDVHFWHNVRTGTVRIGRNTWICPKATVTRGADVGACCIVGSGSVVTGRVPDGHLASGVPAVARPLPLPWLADPRGSAAAAESLAAGSLDGLAPDDDAGA